MSVRRQKIKPGKAIRTRATPSEIIRFLSYVKVQKRETPKGIKGPCWTWTGHQDSKGYGQFWWQGRAVWSHRFSKAQFRGLSMRNGNHVNHKCLHHDCCNPDHINGMSHVRNSIDGRMRQAEQQRGDEIPF